MGNQAFTPVIPGRAGRYAVSDEEDLQDRPTLVRREGRRVGEVPPPPGQTRRPCPRRVPEKTQYEEEDERCKHRNDRLLCGAVTQHDGGFVIWRRMRVNIALNDHGASDTGCGGTCSCIGPIAVAQRPLNMRA